MTLGSGGGAPARIEVVNYTITTGNEVFYTCPTDRMAFFVPILSTNSGGTLNGTMQFHLRNLNPVTAAPVDLLYDFSGGGSGGQPSPMQIGAGTSGPAGNIFGDMTRARSVATEVQPSNTSGACDSKVFRSADIQLFAGEQLKLFAAPAGGRLKYAIVEYVVAT